MCLCFTHIAYCSYLEQTPKLTNCLHMVSCIKMCFLDPPQRYSQGVAADCGTGHRNAPCSALILKSSSSLKSSVSVMWGNLTVWCWTGPQRQIGVDLFGLIDRSYSSLCSGGRWGCVFFRCPCLEPDALFSGSWGGRKNEWWDEMRVEEAEDEGLPLSK